MSFVYSILVMFIIIICIAMLYSNNIYYGYYKGDWVNNTSVLLLFFSISLLFLGFACQIGEEKIKVLAPLLCLNLFFILSWVISLSLYSSFLVTISSSCAIFLLTFITMFILALSKQKNITCLTLPFLFMSILGLVYSTELVSKNYENPFII